MNQGYQKIFFVCMFFLLASPAKLIAQLQDMKLLNVPIDISPDFKDFTNTYLGADSLSDFDPAAAKGTITYKRYQYATRQAFNNMLGVLHPIAANYIYKLKNE